MTPFQRETAVADVMSRRVVTAVPDTSFKELVGSLLCHDVQALPIIDLGGRPMGIVSLADVVAKLAFHGGADHRPMLAGAASRVRWGKSTALVAADLMTVPAPTIAETNSISAAARLLTEHPQLCVVDPAGFLVGTVTHHHVLRVFLRSDAALQTDIEDRLSRTTPALCRVVTVQVSNGVVTLNGTVPLSSMVKHIVNAACHVPGVIDVHNDLEYTVDDQMITGL